MLWLSAGSAVDEIARGQKDVCIGGSWLRGIGYIEDLILLMHVRPPYQLFLYPTEAGAPAHLTKKRLAQLLEAGVALVVPLSIDEEESDATERLIATCDLLDAAGVKNGAKAIDIWLHANWSADLMRRYGHFDNAHTIKRWRSQRNKQPQCM
jgi:hypothetical protein